MISKSILACLAAVVICNMGWSAYAADRELPARMAKYREPMCGCCGCLRVFYDRHRELRSTYGAHFDPRNYDQTVPRFHFGRVRGYPEYYTDLGGIEPHY
jgi:hypothetical protein